MASQTFKNARFDINGVALSCNMQSLTLTYEVESLDETHMGINSRKKKGGLKNWGITANFFQSFACVDATLFGIVGCQTSFELRACNACSGADNPIYEGTVLVQSAPPVGGGVGELLMVPVTFESAGDLRHCAVAS